MNQREKTLSENFKTLWKPTTPLEKQQRNHQVRDIAFFVAATAFIVVFKDKIAKALDGLVGM